MLFLFLWLVKWSKCLLQCLWFQTSVLTWCFCYRVNLPGDAHTEPVLVPPKARRSRAFCASADMKNCRIVQLHRTTFFFFFLQNHLATHTQTTVHFLFIPPLNDERQTIKQKLPQNQRNVKNPDSASSGKMNERLSEWLILPFRYNSICVPY